MIGRQCHFKSAFASTMDMPYSNISSPAAPIAFAFAQSSAMLPPADTCSHSRKRDLDALPASQRISTVQAPSGA